MKSHLGLTLIELIVVLAIIGIILSLTTVGIQSVRESTRRQECESRQHQIGLALIGHEVSKTLLPTNGGWKPGNGVPTGNGTLIDLTVDYAGATANKLGFGVPHTDPRKQTGSWAFAILPWLAQTEAYTAQNCEQRVRVLECPSRSRPASQVAVDDSLGKYDGGNRRWSKVDVAANSKIVGNEFIPVNREWVRDGVSSTILVGEKSYDAIKQPGSSWYFDEPLFSGGGLGTARESTILMMDGQSKNLAADWGSPHGGVVNFTLCDGSIKSLALSVDTAVLEALLSPRAGEIIQE